MIIDLRSDTLTKPTPEMLKAMMGATMDDDVFGEDKTTNELQEKVAKLTGKEAALFVCSGTMANQLAIASQTQLNDEVLLSENCHIFQFEQGAAAKISGVQLRPVRFNHALPDLDALKGAIRFPDIHHPTSKLLCLELTHNHNNGTVPSINEIRKVCNKARELGLKVHIDGARIWNAVIATGTPTTKYSELCDTMMFCFSKGLGTPIGSILVGTKEVIKKAHYFRKGIGGGWRQPGMLAAAANHALDNNIERLSEDHRHAQQIAEAVTSNPNLKLCGEVGTNMVFFKPKKEELLEDYSKRLSKSGVLNGWSHYKAIRLACYLGITDEMIEYTTKQIKSL